MPAPDRHRGLAGNCWWVPSGWPIAVLVQVADGRNHTETAFRPEFDWHPRGADL